jgi:hypothetical protein
MDEDGDIMSGLTLKRVLVLAVLAAGVAFFLIKVRPAERAVSEAAAHIEDELGALPPAERAAVVGKLGKDAAAKARARKR